MLDENKLTNEDKLKASFKVLGLISISYGLITGILLSEIPAQFLSNITNMIILMIILEVCWIVLIPINKVIFFIGIHSISLIFLSMNKQIVTNAKTALRAINILYYVFVGATFFFFSFLLNMKFYEISSWKTILLFLLALFFNFIIGQLLVYDLLKRKQEAE